MRRYEFHSTLPPELVFAILDTNTKPWDLLATGDGTFRYKRKKDGFWSGSFTAGTGNGSG